MDLASLAIFVSLLTLSAFFSGTETALTATSQVALQKLCDEGNRLARIVQDLLRNKGRVIAALLIGNNIVNTALAVFATLVFDSWARTSTILPAHAAPIAASATAVIVLLVFGEVLPKTIAVSYSTRWTLTMAWPTLILVKVFAPVTWLLNKLAAGVMIVLGRKPDSEDIFDVREIHAMATIGESQGVIDEQEAELIQHASQLNDIRVREIMTPRTDITAIEVDTPLAAIRELLHRVQYSRIPVYRTDMDDIVGILHYKDFLRHAPEKDKGFELVGFLHKTLFVPESVFIGDLLKQMQKRRTHLAIVLDEYGGTSGLVTLEDVIEMLVGKIEDEYDEVSVPLEKVVDGTVDVDGRVTDDVLFHNLGIPVDAELSEGFHTVAGLALTAFGNIPSEGDKTTYHGMEITALRVKGNRVRRVRVRRLTEAETSQLESTRDSGRRQTSRLTPEVRTQVDDSGPEPTAAEPRQEP